MVVRAQPDDLVLTEEVRPPEPARPASRSTPKTGSPAPQ